MGFYNELKTYSPFFMRDLAKKLANTTNKKEIERVYKKIYMHIRVYKHSVEWDCQEKKTGKPGRSPLKCVYVGSQNEIKS